MIKDKELKEELLKQFMKDMDHRVLEKDIKPKTKMVVKAEGDSPEDAKEEIIEKLSKLDMPSEEDMPELEEGELPEEEMMEEESEMPEMEEEEDDSYIDELPYALREKLKAKLK